MCFVYDMISKDGAQNPAPFYKCAVIWTYRRRFISPGTPLRSKIDQPQNKNAPKTRITGPLWGESADDWPIPFTKASDSLSLRYHVILDVTPRSIFFKTTEGTVHPTEQKHLSLLWPPHSKVISKNVTLLTSYFTPANFSTENNLTPVS